MKNETAKREIESLDYYLQNHTDDYSEESHTAMMMAIKALEQEPCDVFDEYGNYNYPSDVELTEPNTATSMPCEDAINREDTIDWLKRVTKTDGITFETGFKQILHDIEQMPSVEPVNPQPCEDAISREDALMALTGEWTEITDEIIHRFIKRIKALPPVNPQPKAEQFAKWVAGEIFDDMWEYNKDAFAEIACRKLAKLGIVIRMGDEWELIEPQEREDKE